MSCPATMLVGAYVLGALNSPEQQEFEAHIADCARCGDEAARLLELSPLLGLLAAEDVKNLDAVSASRPPMLDQVLTRAGAAGRRRRRRRFAAAVVATAIILGAATGVGAIVRRSAPATTTITAADERRHVHMVLRLTARPWGTELALKLTGLVQGQHCSLIVLGRDGRADIAATWAYWGKADYVTGSTAIPRDDLAELDVVSAQGVLLLRIPVKS